jgi:UDP-N-acetylmuramyl tripeptide synthase
MLKVDPALITRLAAGKQLTLVSATNGKSTTTRMIAGALRTKGRVAHNLTGANMGPGVVTALAADRAAGFGAIEVDEAHLPAMAAQTGATQLVLMNLTRDQLDRGSEVKMLSRRWHAMAEQLSDKTIILANADDPLVVWAARPAPSVVWVGCGQWWTDDAALCPECGATLERAADGTGIAPWRCPACGLARPQTAWSITPDATGIVTPDGTTLTPHLKLPGRVNVGNAAIAVAAAAGRGIDPAVALAACEQVEDVDGRYINTTVDGHPVRLLLGKNPASWAEMLRIVGTSGAALVTVLNARGQDGRDPSWIWDVPFEQLAPMPVWVSGERRFDLAVRLDTAGLELRGVTEDPLAGLAGLPAGEAVDIVANYTAFQELRARVVK